MAKKVTSKSMSLEGWNFKKFFMGNWKSIKEIVKWILAPGSAALLGITNPTFLALSVPLGKAILDIGEYYFKEYSN